MDWLTKVYPFIFSSRLAGLTTVEGRSVVGRKDTTWEQRSLKEGVSVSQAQPEGQERLKEGASAWRTKPIVPPDIRKSTENGF